MKMTDVTVVVQALLTRGAVLAAAAAATAYFLAEQVSFLYPDSQGILMAVWPAAGVGLASLLLAPRRMWPTIAIAMFAAGNLANAIDGRPFAASLGFMTANIAESLGCAWLITRSCGSRIEFGTVREVLALLVGATLVNGATACIGAATGVVTSGSAFVDAWQTWFVADGLGLLLVTPFVVVWAAQMRLPIERRWLHIAEFGLFAAVWCATAWLVFRGADPTRSDVQPYLLFALLPWPAYRLGQRGTTFALAIAALLSISAASAAAGPTFFGGATATDRLTLVQLFLAVLGAAGLLLTASSMEASLAVRTARAAHERLRSLGDNLPDGFMYQLVQDKSGLPHFTYVSAGIERITGLTQEQALRDPLSLYGLLADEDLYRINASRERSRVGLQPIHETFSARRPDGQVRWIQLSSSPIRLEDGGTQWDGLQLDITEHRLAEDALRDREEMYRNLFDNMEAGVFRTRLDGSEILDVNDKFVEIFGHSRDELKGRPSAILWANPIEREEMVRRLAAEGHVTEFDCRLLNKQGEVLNCRMSLRLGPHTGIVEGSVTDVTETVRAQERLRESEERFRATFDQAAVGIAHVALDGCWLRVNQRLCDITGYEREELLRKSFTDVTDPEDIDSSIEALGRLVAGEIAVHTAEKRYLRRDGSRVWVDITVSVVRKASGEPDYLMSVTEDITDRKRAEAELRRSETSHRTLLEQSPIAIGVHRAGRGIYGNRAHMRMFGYSSLEELMTLGPDDMLAPESRAAAAERVRLRSLGLPVGDEYELVGMRRDGSTFPMLVNSASIELPDGPATLVFHTDLTEVRRADESLRASEEKFAKAFRAAPVLISLTDIATGEFVDVNDEALRLSGFSRDEVIGHTSVEIGWLGAENRARMLEALRANGRIAGMEVEFHARDGRKIVGLVGGEAISISGRECLLTGMIDITERKHAQEERARLEAELAQSQKMETVGRLAGGVAHDFNNMLTAIRGYAELVRYRLPEDRTRDRSDLDEAIRAADRAAELTRQMLAFARKTVTEPRLLDPARGISEFAPMVRRLVGEDVELSLRLRPNAGCIRIDPTQFEQVILNLAVNARDAMPNGGRLTIETSAVVLDLAATEDGPDRRPGSFVALKVVDNGVGMDDETRRRVFEPFFTTKEPGKGTGMGLATVFGIVRMSDGWPEVESTLGEGTTFTLYFPRVDEEQPIAAAPDRSEVPFGSETVLFVEDDPSVRAYGAQCLKALGYTILQASNGADAIAIATKYADRIDLVVSDVVMPGMQGPELVARLAAMRPEVRVLLCSGYEQEAEPFEDSAPGIPRLAKPYSRESLGWAAYAALTGSGEFR
jgi:two-component system cell cycle sensor histidine kinase/response regulator CckA